MEPSSPDPEAAPVQGFSQPGEPPAADKSTEHSQEARIRRKRTFRQTLVVVLSVVALVCLGGSAAAFVFYDKATKPDLSTPTLVTRKYLDTYLVDREDAKAAQ